jgi:cytochrome c biogenesis protein CcmG/thiol:disulfide interchange protein DsbE
MKKLMAVFPIGAFSILLIALGFSLTNDPRKLPSMLIDKAVPNFVLPAVHEGGMRLSNTDLLGKVSLLNVFASWCGGCRYEHPVLMKLSTSGQVPIYGINFKDKPGAGSAWLKKYRDPYKRSGKDPNGRTGIHLGVTGIPETFVIDQTGRVRYRHIGPLTDEIWANTIRPVVDELRAAK